jgi:hypothetical protein
MLRRPLPYLSVLVGLSAFVSAGFAQTYQMELTGVGTGVTADGVYVSPYQGTIVQGGTISGNTIIGGTTLYTGYMICDDFTTDSSLNSPWTATATTAASRNGKFQGETYTVAGLNGGQPFNSQQMYDAVSFLATKLLANLSNQNLQTDYSFAIWDIMDGQTTDPSGGATAQIKNAFEAVLGGYADNNVDVFTASPTGASQEFLVVNGPPVSTPESSVVGLFTLEFLPVLGLLFLLHRRSTARA